MAADFTLDEILHPQVITEAYREVTSASVPNPFTDFYSTQEKNIKGDRFEFIFRPGVSKPAPGNIRGAPARILQPTGLSERNVFLLHAFNELTLSMNALQMLRRPEDESLQEKGRDEILRQMEDFGDRHRQFRNVAVSKSFTDGIVHLNQDGDILESATGAVISLDLQVPASRKNQLAGIIDVAWDDASAKILRHLDDIRIQAQEDNTEMPTDIWANHHIKRFLRENTEIKDFVAGGPEAVDGFLKGTTIQDLGGYTWHFYSGTFEDVNGVTQPILPIDQIVITPPVGSWLRAVNGSELITSFEGISQSVEVALRDVTEVFGDFAYVKLMDNPTKLVLRMGTNFVYAFANEKSVWMPTVDF